MELINIIKYKESEKYNKNFFKTTTFKEDYLYL